MCVCVYSTVCLVHCIFSKSVLSYSVYNKQGHIRYYVVACARKDKGTCPATSHLVHCIYMCKLFIYVYTIKSLCIYVCIVNVGL